MTNCTLTQDQIKRAISFHGHECPGLWIGMRAAELCLRELGHHDENPLIAVVETDMCGIDGIQSITGCTFGKGNLIHRDFGKMVFTFYRSSDGKALRMSYRHDVMRSGGEELGQLLQKNLDGTITESERQRIAQLKEQSRQWIFSALLSELFAVTTPTSPPPRAARILSSLTCSVCGESTMESRTRRFDGQTCCMPCFAEMEQKV